MYLVFNQLVAHTVVFMWCDDVCVCVYESNNYDSNKSQLLLLWTPTKNTKMEHQWIVLFFVLQKTYGIVWILTLFAAEKRGGGGWVKFNVQIHSMRRNSSDLSVFHA